MKKEKNNVLEKPKIDYYNVGISLFMLFLLQFIILPPFFRTFVKASTTDEVNHNKSKKILICDGFDYNNAIVVHSSTFYLNNDPVTNTITYEVVNDKESFKKDNLIKFNILEELSFFKSINGIKVSTNKNITTVIIHDYIVDKNNSNYLLLDYLTDKDKQKEAYENMGYKCKIKTM